MSEKRDVIVTSDLVKDLVCPFTGKPLEVHMIIQPGMILYSAPDAFSLREPVQGLNQVLNRASMRNGIEGVVSGKDAMIDPYTGEALTLHAGGDSVCFFSGGFNPRRGYSSLEEFVYYASMRMGKSKIQKPGSIDQVVEVKKHRHLKEKVVEPSQPSLEVAEKLIDRHPGFLGKHNTTVVVEDKVQ